jgi:hypothetical protein
MRGEGEVSVRIAQSAVFWSIVVALFSVLSPFWFFVLRFVSVKAGWTLACFLCLFSPFSSACEFAVNGTLSRLFLFTLQSIARRLTHLIHDATH